MNWQNELHTATKIIEAYGITDSDLYGSRTVKGELLQIQYDENSKIDGQEIAAIFMDSFEIA